MTKQELVMRLQKEFGFRLTLYLDDRNYTELEYEEYRESILDMNF
ncbi:hypothetical protein RD055328_08610 [Companilactobacillus sp. RD055328]|nr:hypothetical protein RD055328_08610 [Companilactobacillus sp. RD055328]